MNKEALQRTHILGWMLDDLRGMADVLIHTRKAFVSLAVAEYDRPLTIPEHLQLREFRRECLRLRQELDALTSEFLSANDHARSLP
jgi:hypothetical protein